MALHGQWLMEFNSGPKAVLPLLQVLQLRLERFELVPRPGKDRALHLEEAANGIRAIGLSPGTVATEMQRTIKASGINPVSQLDWDVHIPADWPARCLLWMCSPEADTYCGEEISLREENIRRAVGLI